MGGHVLLPFPFWTEHRLAGHVTDVLYRRTNVLRPPPSFSNHLHQHCCMSFPSNPNPTLLGLDTLSRRAHAPQIW
jgi:hypothetical protein